MTGLVLIVVILFMPEGLLGQALKWWNARRGAPAASSAPVQCGRG